MCGININLMPQNSSPIAKVHVGVVNMKTILRIRYCLAIIAPKVVQPKTDFFIQESKME